MAVSKVILNNTTLIDVTDDTVESSKLLSGITATQSDGVEISGSIASLGATTYNTSTSDQTIASGKYISDTQTIKAVTTANIDAGNIKKDVVVTVGDANSATRIKNVTGTFTTTPSGKTALIAAALRSGYAGFINGSQVNGSMADTTVTEGTTTVSSGTATRGTWSQTAGYTAARTIPYAKFASSATSGTTYVDISADSSQAPVLVAGDYLYINKGYTDDLKISLAKLVPDGSDVKGHGEYILSGHSAYDNDGTLVSGSIPTIASTDLTVSGKTVTVPVGFYTGVSGATAVTANVADGDYSASIASHSIVTMPSVTPSITGSITGIIQSSTPSGTDGSDYWVITPTGTVANPGMSKAKAKATISTEGYISTGNKESTESSINISAGINAGITKYLRKAVLTATATGATATTTVPPGTVSISKQSTPSGVTNAANGNATTTVPTSGVYVAVLAAAAANTTGTTSSISGTGTAKVSTSGYAPHTLTGPFSISGTATAKTSAKNSSMTYVPIKTDNPTFSSPTPSGGSTATGTNATLTSTDNGIKIQTAYTVDQASVTYNLAVNGWVTKTKGTEAVKTTARGSTNSTTYYVSAVKLVKPSSGTRAFTVTSPDKNGTDHTYLFTTDTAGNTSIKVDNTLTMQWNETDQCLDFISM